MKPTLKTWGVLKVGEKITINYALSQLLASVEKTPSDDDHRWAWPTVSYFM